MLRAERVDEAMLPAPASILDEEWDFTVWTLCEDDARYTARVCSENPSSVLWRRCVADALIVDAECTLPARGLSAA